MATTTVAYGSISIVDISDIGELSVYPKSNLPLSVIYNPDQNSFTPNWGSSNLYLVPSIWYSGESLITVTETQGVPSATLASGVSVTWSRQEGTSGSSSLTTGETVTNGILRVNVNKFTENSTMLSYIVTVSYLESTSGQTLTAQGEITFTLVKQAPTVKNVTITGDSVFLYKGDGSIKGATTITLNGRATNGAIGGWQYQLSNGNWATYPNSGTSNTLTVSHTADVFNSDKCVIKLLHSDSTNENPIFDLHTITKLQDGAAGTSTTSSILTNEDQMIPCDSSGTPTATAFTDAKSRIIIYEGNDDDTANWNIALSSSNVTYEKSIDGVTYVPSSASGNNYSYVKVTGMSTGIDTGNIAFLCTKSFVDTDGQTKTKKINKTFSLVKIKTGADGRSPVVYSLEPTTYALNKTPTTQPTFTPATVTFYAYQTQDQTKSAYSGRFKIYENIDAASITSSTTALYTSGNDESSKTYTPSASCNSIVCILFPSGSLSFENILDKQTVITTTNGQTGGKGDKGDNGNDAINIIFGNSYDGIPVNSNGVTTVAYPVDIPFAGYKGTSKVATTVGTLPTLLGITGRKTDATASADGHIYYDIPAGRDVSSYPDGGVLAFTFTIQGKTVAYDYSWGKVRQSKDGVNSVLVQLSTPQGNVFENGSGSLDIVATIYDGTTDVSTASGTEYEWAKFVNGGYSTISGAETRTLTVSGSTVDGYASYRCIVGYGGNSYTQYMSLIDKTDPLQVMILSSVGDKLINGKGVGALYAKIYRNGQEIDPMYTENFVVGEGNLPTSASQDDYCYVLDSEHKTISLRQYDVNSNPRWQPSSDTYTGRYQWFYRDKDGETTTSGTPSSGDVNPQDHGSKVIYIDGDLVDKKLIVDVKVTI